ncbi:hypothetical protein BDB01DRAFT_792676 [Pilobolus umbonatus]|nr:hypothetical protein BDB01DRAFT_792676 [Pilobolus umbonatus]
MPMTTQHYIIYNGIQYIVLHFIFGISGYRLVGVTPYFLIENQSTLLHILLTEICLELFGHSLLNYKIGLFTCRIIDTPKKKV